MSAKDVHKFVTNGVHISYWVEEMGEWLASLPSEDFERIAGLLMDSRNQRIKMGLLAHTSEQRKLKMWQNLALSMAEIIGEMVKDAG